VVVEGLVQVPLIIGVTQVAVVVTTISQVFLAVVQVVAVETQHLMQVLLTVETVFQVAVVDFQPLQVLEQELVVMAEMV
jgi:hypothetical protein